MLVQFGAGGALYPYLTLYFEERGLSAPRITLITLGAAGASTVFPFFWGWIADRILALNRLVPLMHLAAAALLAILGAIDGFALLFIGFTLYVGLQQPTNALAQALCYHNLSCPAMQFGRLRLWGSVGWILPAAIVFAWHTATGCDGLSFAIYLAVSIELLLVAASPFLPHTPPPGRNSESPPISGLALPLQPARRFRDDLGRLVRAPGFLLILALSFLMSSAISIMFYYSNLRLEQVGIPKKYIGPLLALGVVLEIPLFAVLKRVLARCGYPATLALGVTASLLRQAVFGLSSCPVCIAVSSLLVAPCVVFYLITASLAVDEIARREVRATAQSLLTLVGPGLGTLAGILVSFCLSSAEEADWSPAFLFAAGTSAAGLLVTFFLRAAMRDTPPGRNS